MDIEAKGRSGRESHDDNAKPKGEAATSAKGSIAAETTIPPPPKPAGKTEQKQSPPPDTRADNPWAELRDVLADEWRLIQKLRGTGPAGRPPGEPPSHERRAEGPTDLFGLALSGGGIRSATFSLGVIQALAQMGWLRQIDYLSTVSGGGYIGAWLSACILRSRKEGRGTIQDVERRMAPRSIRRAGEEPGEIRFLRAYSNYLTPRLGLLSGDTLAAIAGFCCNLGLNLFLGVVSASLIVAFFYWIIALALLDQQNGAIQLRDIATAGCFVSLAAITFLLVMQAHDGRESHVPDAMLFFQSYPRAIALAPLAVGLVAGSVWWGSIAARFASLNLQDAALIILIAPAIGTLYASFIRELDKHPRDGALAGNAREKIKSATFLTWNIIKGGITVAIHARWAVVRYVIAAILCAALGYAISEIALPVFSDFTSGTNSEIYLVFFGPPLAAAVLWLFYLLWMGVAGNAYSEFTREWLSRFAGELMGLAGLWLLASTIVIYARPSFEWTVDTITANPLYARILLVSLVIVGIAAAVIAQRSGPSTGIPAGVKPRHSRLPRLVWWLVVLIIMTSLTILYQDALVMLLRHAGLGGEGSPDVNFDSQWVPDADFDSAGHATTYGETLNRHLSELASALSLAATPEGFTPFGVLGLMPTSTLLLLLALLVLAGFAVIDVNTFSLQNLYRNRLVRCYLGAAHFSQRLENPFAGFDPRDDFELKLLAEQRPYLLMNAALNITQGQDLAWQQRKAASFVFSPRWCGFWLESTEMSSVVSRVKIKGGYVRTEHYVNEHGGFREVSQGLMVGSAMATSGAAVSSQMGFASRGPLAFILTLLNMRLGRWFPNPAHKKPKSLWRRWLPDLAARKSEAQWAKQSPRLGAFWYLRELLGKTNERSNWVYVSDGGHFENLGIYELVRRRCSRIICVDAGADPRRTFADLGNAVQKCRVDFGVEIKIDTGLLRGANNSGDARGYALGVVEYPAIAGSDGFKGTIIYIKPSIPEEFPLPADILSYHARHPEFPHEATRNQWFSETQFESYRHLGYLIGVHAFQDAKEGRIPARKPVKEASA
jgi:hypothetical protein